MRRWQRPSLHPSTFAGALLLFVLFHILRSVFFFPVLFPSVSSAVNSPAPAIAFVISTDPKKTLLCERTWLKRLSSYITFTSRRSSARQPRQVYLPHRSGSLWSSFSSKALFAEFYVPHHYSWYIMTSDDSYVLVDDLMQELAAFDSDEPYLAVIGPSDMQKTFSLIQTSKQLHSLIVTSRGAMITLWDNLHSRRNGCGVTSSPELCLDDIVQLNLREDAHGKFRFFVLQRHFSKFEMSQYTYLNGHYNDGLQVDLRSCF
ncbi:unnamed protein product [Strongylus vulgaris]|uniref:Hexosyltransferase n=1 Tax=Strongylus vulgaris TaxID=40348 RepID=A0A3P7IJ93_STRVU|nr:unnamed protein product [Strongylus vulgaris]